MGLFGSSEKARESDTVKETGGTPFKTIVGVKAAEMGVFGIGRGPE